MTAMLREAFLDTLADACGARGRPLQRRDVVRLICGGPDMVVEAVDHIGGGAIDATCMWHDQDGRIQRAVINGDFLERAPL